MTTGMDASVSPTATMQLQIAFSRQFTKGLLQDLLNSAVHCLALPAVKGCTIILNQQGEALLAGC